MDNIWGSIDFTQIHPTKSCLDYLNEQGVELATMTSNKLKLEVDVERNIYIGKVQYICYVVPRPFFSRVRIFTVIEHPRKRFPVLVVNNFNLEVFTDISEYEFISVIQKIIDNPKVKGAIEFLYSRNKM